MDDIWTLLESRYLDVLSAGRWYAATGRTAEAREFLTSGATEADVDAVYAADDTETFALLSRPVDVQRACKHGALRLLEQSNGAEQADTLRQCIANADRLHLCCVRTDADKVYAAALWSGSAKILAYLVENDPEISELSRGTRNFAVFLPHMRLASVEFLLQRAAASGSPFDFGDRWFRFALLQCGRDAAVVDMLLNDARYRQHMTDVMVFQIAEAVAINAKKRLPDEPTDAAHAIAAAAWLRALVPKLRTLSLEQLAAIRNPRLAAIALPIILKRSEADFKDSAVRYAALESEILETVVTVFSVQDALDPLEYFEGMMHFISRGAADCARFLRSFLLDSDIIDLHYGSVGLHWSPESMRLAIELGLHRLNLKIHLRPIVSLVCSGIQENSETAELMWGWMQTSSCAAYRESQLREQIHFLRPPLRAVRWLTQKYGIDTVSRAMVSRQDPFPAETEEELRWSVASGLFVPPANEVERESVAIVVKFEHSLKSAGVYATVFPGLITSDFFFGAAVMRGQRIRTETPNAFRMTYTTADFYAFCAALRMTLTETERQWEICAKISAVKCANIDWAHIRRVYAKKG